jgi:MFS family permease
MKKNKYTNILGILTIPLIILCIFLAGGGHGTYIPIVAVFPLGFIGIFLHSEKISMLFYIFAVLQLPIFGYFLDKFGVRKALPFIIPIHCALVGVAFLLESNF